MATSNNESGYVDNWQTGKSVTECNEHMLTTKARSDVTFHVGNEKKIVQAHRYVLVSRSCVFDAMFCGPLAEKGEVTIPDISPNIFEDFMRYIYTDSVYISEHNVIGLLYTSRKYAVDALQRECTQYLESCLTENNVCWILEECHNYGEVDLEQKALEMLCEATEVVVSHQDFEKLCFDCLEKFLKSDRLRMKEEQIFEGTLFWTEQACHHAGVPVTHKNMRKFLGDMVYEIRFTSMPLNYLVNGVGPSNLLSQNERISLMDKAFNPDLDIYPFKSTPRGKHQPTVTVHRFSGRDYWGKSSVEHTISFSANQIMYLVGCRMYAPHLKTNRCSVSVKVMNKDTNVVLQSFKESLYLERDRELKSIMFPEFVHLTAGSKYTLSVRLPDIYIWCGAGNQQSVDVDGVTITFMDTPYASSGAITVSKAEIPGLIFKKFQKL